MEFIVTPLISIGSAVRFGQRLRSFANELVAHSNNELLALLVCREDELEEFFDVFFRHRFLLNVILCGPYPYA
jgi:hypothetical protein